MSNLALPAFILQDPTLPHIPVADRLTNFGTPDFAA
jgi:hypothetical protein